MMPGIEPVLYRDEQTLPPVGFCHRCGGVIYRWGAPCERCGEVKP